MTHLLWNVVGTSGEPIDPQVIQEPLQDQDLILLCTDGLTRHLPDARIADILLRSARQDEVVQQLIDEANTAGGTDNITIVVAQCHAKNSGNGPDPLSIADAALFGGLIPVL
jgi:protein phosphatase